MASTSRPKPGCILVDKQKKVQKSMARKSRAKLGKSDMKNCGSNYIRNGNMLQEELISFCNGKNLPIHVYSAKEVAKMSGFTDEELLYWDVPFKMYKGVVKKRRVYVKYLYELFELVGTKGIIREIVVATQMGAHQNNLKLLGYCLETEFPVLIYEYPERGRLLEVLDKFELPWKKILRIGYHIAYAIAYLQNGFHRPVVHRNLSAKDVFLDDNYVAKLSGFHFSVAIPEGEDHLYDSVVGTTGGFGSPPEYIASGRLTEKTDVYSFGGLFMHILATYGLCTFSYQDKIFPRLDKVSEVIFMEARENRNKHQELQVLDLVSRCLAAKEEDRPNIVDVTVQLKKLLDDPMS